MIGHNLSFATVKISLSLRDIVHVVGRMLETLEHGFHPETKERLFKLLCFTVRGVSRSHYPLFFFSFFFFRTQVEDYEEEPLLKTGCKEYFWLLCKLIDNIHVKDTSQVRTFTADRDSVQSRFGF